MKILARNIYASERFEEELNIAKISAIEGKWKYGEVLINITGSLNQFVFKRAWSYVVVSGEFTQIINKEIMGVKDIVKQHCGDYHIFSQIALNYFAKIIQ